MPKQLIACEMCGEQAFIEPENAEKMGWELTPAKQPEDEVWVCPPCNQELADFLRG